MQSSHSVDVVGADDSEVGHAHALFFPTLDATQGLLLLSIAWVSLADLLHEHVVHMIDKIHVARKHVLHHVYRPLLQSLGEHCVIGVSESLGDDGPSLIIRQFLNIKKDSEKLDSSDCGMGVIQLNLVKLREIVPVGVIKLEALNNILNGTAAEEVLLLESQLLALPGAVIRVEDTSDVLSSLSFHDRLVILSIVKFLKVELITGTRSPKAESVCVVSIETWDRGVIGHSDHSLTAVPVGNTWSCT